MFLKSIDLENFACFEDLSLTFDRDTDLSNSNLTADELADAKIRKWTVLVGTNGTGKSALLKGVALLTAGTAVLGELLGPDPGSWIHPGKTRSQLRATLQTKTGEMRQLSLVLRRGESTARTVAKNKKCLADLDEAITHAKTNYFVIGYGATRRLNPAATKSRESSNSGGRDFRYLRIRTLFDPEEALNPLESWAIQMQRKGQKEGVTIVRDTLNTFLRGVEFERLDTDRKQLMFRTPDGVVPLRSLGLGHQTMAAWIGDLLYQVTSAFRRYTDPLSTRGLLLLDELDLHLHPEWQKHLISFLTEKLPNFQLLVTTHSPVTAQQTGPGELYILKRRGKSVTSLAFPGDPRKLLLHQLLMSDAFGFDSDESLKVQEKKHEYRQLRDKKRKSKGDEERLVELVVQMQELPTDQRRNLPLADTEMADLRRIYKDLVESKR